jgi:hypothetical protein
MGEGHVKKGLQRDQKWWTIVGSMVGVVEAGGTKHGDSGVWSGVLTGPSELNHFGPRNALLPTGEAVSEPLTPSGRCRGSAHD